MNYYQLTLVSITVSIAVTFILSSKGSRSNKIRVLCMILGIIQMLRSMRTRYRVVDDDTSELYILCSVRMASYWDVITSALLGFPQLQPPLPLTGNNVAPQNVHHTPPNTSGGQSSKGQGSLLVPGANEAEVFGEVHQQMHLPQHQD